MRKILCAIIGLFAMTAHAATTDVCDFDIANIYKVGTPTITNAGIYTTNSSESYIRTQNDVAFATANTWSFKWRFTYHPANSDQGIMSGNGGTNVQAIINSAGRPRFSFGNDTSWNAGVWNDTALTFAYQDGVTYDNEIYFDGTRYGFKVNGTEIGGVDNTTKAANTYFAIGVERGREPTQYSRAEWDLTHTSLTLDGVEQLPWCGKQIKVATTKYVESEFAPMVSALANAVATVNTVVSNTITQAASIATLQSGKQTRPADDTCPAYKQCLLVENGKPHWYQITDPFRDFVAPIIANNVNGASRGFYRGYTQLEYIESTGTQYIDTGVQATGDLDIKTRFKIISYGGLFGVRDVATGSSNKAVWLAALDARTIWLYNNKVTHNNLEKLNLAQWYDVDIKKGVLSFNGNEVASYETENFTGSDIFLFNTNEANGTLVSGASVQISYFKIYDASGTLVRNFVPVVNNKTGTIGMYDTVGGQFYGNAATSGADFTPGPIVDKDADVPGDSWAVTWTANATTGVSAGTVRGTTRCTAASATPGTGTAWNTLETGTGVSCWCIVSGVNVDGTDTVASELMARFYGSYGKLIDCSFNCPVFCADAVKDQNTFRKGLFGM